MRNPVRTPIRAEIGEAHNWCDRWCERCPLADRCSIGRSAGVASHTLVPTKLHRASSSRALGSSDDAARSAKVASLGLASVVDALTSHCQRAPHDSAGLALFIEACALMEAVEERFPNHLSSRRPGFDP